ncbi:MAG TPA: HD domain-containing protein [Chryseolinea sp.]
MILNNTEDLFADAEHFVRKLFYNHLPNTRFFHTIHHTAGVVEQCEALGTFYSISSSDAEKLLLAAWFHDTGYCFTSVNHEAKSSKIATEYLTSLLVPPENISQVVQLIQSTKMDYCPDTLLEKIIHDADTHHLASENYPILSQLLKRELIYCDGLFLSDKEWNEQNISFFKQHHFHTQRASELWNEKKLNRLQSLLKARDELFSRDA